MAVRIEGYAIVSVDGMIADKDGRMTETLIVEADQRFYEESLSRAALIVHGRNSAEPGSQATRRRRAIVTSRIEALQRAATDTDIWLWNPRGLPFAELLRRLRLDDGIVAVVGGTQVFDLFLAVGYDGFYLTRSARGSLPGGRPVFAAVPARTPEQILTEAGLTLVEERELEPGVILAVWEQTTPQF
jgi:dihydrofolate reductase